jgi:RNA polymerase sigma factor (sigma-70 family)
MRDQTDNAAVVQPATVLPPDWVQAYRKYLRFWTNLARSAYLGEDEAKDLVQTVVAATLAQPNRTFESLEHIRNYVARGVLNRATQVRQRSDRYTRMTEQIEIDLATIPEEPDRDEAMVRAVLLEAIRQLARKDSEILKLRFYSGLTFQEISQMLNMPVSTLKSREEAALKKVRAWFRKKGLGNVYK